MKIDELIIAVIGKEFPFFPVTVEESPEDDRCLWVRLFAVPPEEVRRVKDFIHDLQDRFAPNMGTILLPMVKNVSTTSKYYPEFLQRAAEARLQETLRSFGGRMTAHSQKIAISREYSWISPETSFDLCRSTKSSLEHAMAWLDDLSGSPAKVAYSASPGNTDGLSVIVTAVPDLALAA